MSMIRSSQRKEMHDDEEKMQRLSPGGGKWGEPQRQRAVDAVTGRGLVRG
jgi:hypothetical protein